MTYNTGNPVPSADPRDLDDNAQAFDRFMQSAANQELDRLGVPRLTWHYVEQAATALVNPNVIGLASLTSGQYKVPMFNNSSGAMVTIDTGALGRILMALANTDAGKASGRAALGLTLGGANGVAQLGADGLLPPALLPALAVNDTFTVASQAAMLALTAQRGDVAIRTDLSGAAYILTTDDPTTLANWVAIQQNLGVALQALSAVSPASNSIPYFNGTSTASKFTATSYGRSLLGNADAPTTRTYLGAAASGANSDITSLTGLTTALSVAQGGTGASTAAAARTALGVTPGTWTDLTLQNSWSKITGRVARYRAFLDMVQVEIQITGGTATDGTVVATLPAGFRPLATLVVAIVAAPSVAPSSTVAMPRLVIGTDGTLACLNVTSTAGITGVFQFSTL